MDIGVDYSHLYENNRKNQKRKIYTDGMRAKQVRKKSVPLDGLQFPAHSNYLKNPHTILLNDKRDRFYGVQNPQRYIMTQKQRQALFRQQYIKTQQSLGSTEYTDYKQNLQKHKKSKKEWKHDIIQNTYNVFASYRNALQLSFSPTRMWQLSLTGAMIFGMVSMSLIYRNLGQSAFAKESAERALAVTEEKEIVQMVDEPDVKEKIITSKTEVEKKEEVKPVVVTDILEKEHNQKNSEKKDAVQTKEKKSTKKAVDSAQKKDAEKVNNDEIKKDEKTLDNLAHNLVDGYPIEKMLPYILEQDPEVAKYLIAIAKQESGWGKRVPVLNGQDCYNYWGYRGTRKLMGSGGHTCFNSRKDAVETVGKRIQELIYKYDRKTAKRLIVWKCGSSCAGHSQEGVDRWISVVNRNYQKLSVKNK